MKTVRVAVYAADPLTKIGLMTCLEKSPQITLTAMGEAETVVVAVKAVDSSALELLRGLPWDTGGAVARRSGRSSAGPGGG